MPLTGSHATAYGAGLAGICRVRKLNPDAGSFRLVGDKRLQLRPGPSMEPGAHSFAGLDPFADVGQVLHGDGAAFVSNCFRDNSLADFVIHMSDMPGFATGDFLQQLPCRLRAVALKPGTKGKVFVAVMPELAAPEYLSGADGGDGVLPEVHTGDRAGGSFRWVGKVENEVEIVPALSANQFSLFGHADVKILPLELAQFHRDDNSAFGSEQGDRFPLDAVSALVEVNGAGRLEGNQGPVGFPQAGVVGH